MRDALICDAVRMASARRAGLFAGELVPVEIHHRRGEQEIIGEDEHPGPDTTLETLAALPTPFRAGGSVTAENVSGVCDGARMSGLDRASRCSSRGSEHRSRRLDTFR